MKKMNSSLKFLPLVLCVTLMLAAGCAQGRTPAPPASPQASAGPTGPLEGITIALDPGHGGDDGGCVGASGATEAELNLQVAFALRDALQQQGAQVVLTRNDETVVYQTDSGKTRKQQDMAGRMDVIEQARAQLVVSIHMNRYSDAGVRGAQVFYFEEGSAGQRLAQQLQQSLNSLEEQVKKRNAASGNYFILKTPQCPSALVECGFLSNPQEEALLQDAAYQGRLAQALCEGIITYYQQPQAED